MFFPNCFGNRKYTDNSLKYNNINPQIVSKAISNCLFRTQAVFRHGRKIAAK